MELTHPPEGKVQASYNGSGMGFIEWAPGNGLVIRMIATDLPRVASDNLGGNVLLSFNSWRSDPTTLGIPLSIYELGGVHLDYIREKFPEESEEWAGYVTALINWCFGPTETVLAYAQEVYQTQRHRYL